MGLAPAGLLLIMVAWFVQLGYSWKGNRTIHPVFIVFYMIGVAALTIADYMATNALSYFELLTLLAAGALFIRIVAVKEK